MSKDCTLKIWWEMLSSQNQITWLKIVKIWSWVPKALKQWSWPWHLSGHAREWSVKTCECCSDRRWFGDREVPWVKKVCPKGFGHKNHLEIWDLKEICTADSERFLTKIQNPQGIYLERKKKGNLGRANVPLETVKQKILAIWTCLWQMIQQMLASAEIPKSTLHRKWGQLRAWHFTWWVKPCLTMKEKQDCLWWMTNSITKSGKKFEFMNFRHTLHLDKKWFYEVGDEEKCGSCQTTGCH